MSDFHYLKEFGGPENLSPGDLPIPRVEPGTVLIRAVASSVDPADVSIINGTPFSPILPAVLGCDVAGVVEAVGDGVTEFAPGSLPRPINRQVMPLGEADVE
jgi:NADPH:quinone reductase